MAVHSLGGHASVDVTSVTGTFTSVSPRIERADDSSRFLRISRPAERNHGATITFRFKPKDIPQGTSFGIKQFISVDWYYYELTGNKPSDGYIWQRYRPLNRHMLDVATQSLTINFDPVTNMPTGARAVAKHAPFFEAVPVFFKSGADAELSIGDTPGGAFPMEMRNVATDRINYLASVRVKQTFLTVLTAVSERNVHTPLEAAYWQHNVQGNVTWDSSGAPDVSKITSVYQGLFNFREINNNFLVCDFGLLTNASLTVADSIVQQYHDALYAMRGMYQRQDFSKPTRVETKLEVRGFQLIQYPMHV